MREWESREDYAKHFFVKKQSLLFLALVHQNIELFEYLVTLFTKFPESIQQIFLEMVIFFFFL